MEPDLLQGLDGDTINPQEPAAVLAARIITKGGESVNQLLIQWKGKAVEEASWEEELYIRSQFPKFRLEDKYAFQGTANDRTVAEQSSTNGLLAQQLLDPKCGVYVRKNRKGDRKGGRENAEVAERKNG